MRCEAVYPKAEGPIQAGPRCHPWQQPSMHETKSGLWCISDCHMEQGCMKQGIEQYKFSAAREAEANWASACCKARMHPGLPCHGKGATGAHGNWCNMLSAHANGTRCERLRPEPRSRFFTYGVAVRARLAALMLDHPLDPLLQAATGQVRSGQARPGQVRSEQQTSAIQTVQHADHNIIAAS